MVLIYDGNASLKVSVELYLVDSLDLGKVKGEIVLCKHGNISRWRLVLNF